MKKRLDQLLTERDLAVDLTEARALIGAGQVLVNTGAGCKAGTLVKVDSEIRVKRKCRFVSRGGLKLEGGLRDLAIDPGGLICADIGCSTGGFTDCLLQRGAARVYCVDVGYGLLDWKLRRDKRVILLERTNARYLTRQHIPEPLDFAVLDASFISLRRLIAPLIPLFGGKIQILALVKPQFELPKEKVAVGGVVREDYLHDEALSKVKQAAKEIGLACTGEALASVCGAKGNQEFLLHFTGVRI
ncbi:MAG: TlyA family RNA methyltransferase [Candidatus Electrothrix sp. AR4]|nr:TlyA family RNA methyltransferase [Candidatus Electrothrix sp. AR4]